MLRSPLLCAVALASASCSGPQSSISGVSSALPSLAAETLFNVLEKATHLAPVQKSIAATSAGNFAGLASILEPAVSDDEFSFNGEVFSGAKKAYGSFLAYRQTDAATLAASIRSAGVVVGAVNVADVDLYVRVTTAALQADLKGTGAHLSLNAQEAARTMNVTLLIATILKTTAKSALALDDLDGAPAVDTGADPTTTTATVPQGSGSADAGAAAASGCDGLSPFDHQYLVNGCTYRHTQSQTTAPSRGANPTPSSPASPSAPLTPGQQLPNAWSDCPQRQRIINGYNELSCLDYGPAPAPTPGGG